MLSSRAEAETSARPLFEMINREFAPDAAPRQRRSVSGQLDLPPTPQSLGLNGLPTLLREPLSVETLPCIGKDRANRRNLRRPTRNRSRLIAPYRGYSRLIAPKFPRAQMNPKIQPGPTSKASPPPAVPALGRKHLRASPELRLAFFCVFRVFRGQIKD